MKPYWPRSMKRATAAAYCDLSESAFEREVFAGRLPASVKLGGREHWDIKALDKALDKLTGQDDADVPDYRRELQERYGSQAA